MTIRGACFWWIALLAATLVKAQPIVTPTPDMPDEIEEAGDYTISNSFEVGYRMSNVSGNHDVYRSSVNFGNGVRLFEGQLRINSKEGRGTLIDNLSFHTVGQGEDPYRFTRLEIEKNGWFRYDMQIRANRFFNRLPSLWSGERGQWSERTFQNHDFRLFPDSRFEILLGYDRNSQTGPGFGSEGIARDFGAFRNENFLRLTRDLIRQNNQYRAGFDARVAGLAITFIQAFDNYKEGHALRRRFCSSLALAERAARRELATERTDPWQHTRDVGRYSNGERAQARLSGPLCIRQRQPQLSTL